MVAALIGRTYLAGRQANCNPDCNHVTEAASF
jgi:hypothetical protein